jgi:signal peptidase II
MSRLYGWVLVLFGLDQFTKYLARHQLSTSGIDFGLFRFDLVYNTGAAYGLFSGFSSVLMWLGIGVVIYLVYGLSSLAKTRLDGVAYVCLLAGAMGNTVDRIFMGKVTDFINIHILPVFNVADILLNIGIAGLILGVLLHGKKTKTST